MNRGYFDDIKDLKKHGGKIALANPNVSSKLAAPKFPTLIIRSATGDTSIIPSQNLVSENKTPHVTLVCIAFRANTQSMVESWTVPFFDAFKFTPGVQLFEVSWIDSWFLSLRPVQSLLLQFIRKEEIRDDNQLTKRQVMYAFGDSYDVRKMLNIKNRLSGYVFLLDEEGYVRWQASGMATPEELSFMVSCTSRLIKECH
ncbi:hypothetical protein O6H91_16G001200 [Diphasiastrum complanatum]|nr:hypothetical protein O6H91_16G001200 [Diphasiastrum complanatum]